MKNEIPYNKQLKHESYKKKIGAYKLTKKS